MAWSSQTTAEHVLLVAEANTAYPSGALAPELATFVDISPAQADAALGLAVELNLSKLTAGKYFADSNLCRFLSLGDQAVKSTVLRVVLETYDPFITFRERWLSTADLAKAANQTALKHALTLHREALKETFVSLATFAGIFVAKGGGRYELADAAAANPLITLVQACQNAAAAEQRVRLQLGPAASEHVSKTDVIDPLVTALLHCTQPDGALHAVVAAANAVESFLFTEGLTRNLTVGNAPGINAKLVTFRTAQLLPEKLQKVGSYIGGVRNAADHGIDGDIQVPWTVQQNTGIEFTFVCCSFIANFFSHLSGTPGLI